MQSEFEFINNLRNRYGLNKIGDDAAVLPKDSKTDLVISTDMLVEDIDFRLDWLKPFWFGHKVLTVSLSDIAAMGAKPVWSMMSIGIPEKIWNTDFVNELYRGYISLAKKYNVELIGGDVSKTPDKMVIDSIVIGEVEKGKAVLRSTAKVGDFICVTGDLGGANAGLKLLEHGIRYDEPLKTWHMHLLNKQLTPTPRNGEDLLNFATSMIDVSDGLVSDLLHICNASRVSAKIFSDKIPIHVRLEKLSMANVRKYLSENLDILDFALYGGEDFELLFTVNPNNLRNFKKNYPHKFTHIGEITESVGIIELITDDVSEILPPLGYRHF